MHFTKTSILAVALAVLDIAHAIPQNRNNGNNNNNGNTGNNANNNNNNAANNGNNAAAAQTLLAANLQSASASDGNPNKTAGQSASLTDKANFINFCSGKTITNGQQITSGSCNGIVMGDMPSQDTMVSSIIINPGPGDNIDANTDFTIQVQVANLLAGTFTNAQDSYYSAPQQLSGGKIVGHTHVVVQDLGNSLSPNTPPDAKTFAFFKGIDDDGNGQGLLSATVTGGLPAGNYRVCSMSSSSNHQPVLMPVAQRGAQDDCQKFTVGGNGGNTKANAGTGTNANGNQNGNANTGNNNGGSKTTTAASAQSSTNGRSGGQNGNQNGNSGAGNNNSGSKTTSAVGTQSSGNSHNGNQNGNGQANGQANNGNSGDSGSRTTTAASSQSTTGGRTGNQNVNGQANNGNNGNIATSGLGRGSQGGDNQQNSGFRTRTTSSNNSQETGMMDTGAANGVVNEKRRYQARAFIV